MNISYRSVWNHAIGAWVAVSEIVRGRGKRGRSGRAAMRVLALAALMHPGASSYAQTIVEEGTLVVGSDGQLGGDPVIVDNWLGLDATLQVSDGVAIGNEVILNNQGALNNAGTLARNADGDVAVGSDGGGGIVNNDATGTIEANGVDGQGVAMGDGPVQVTNSGTIQALGNGGRAVYIYANAGDTLAVNNQAGGKIMGAGTGVQINGSGTVTNSGQIATGNGSTGITIQGGAGKVTNQDGGRITAVATGVLLESGEVSNSGVRSVISAVAADGLGVFITSGTGKVTNEGSITGGLGGIRIWGPGTVVNTGGTIRVTADDQGHGVEIVDGLGTVTNQGGGTIAGKFYGVNFANGGTITNSSSTISADGTDPFAAGVGIAGSLIKGPSAGVRLLNGGTVTNGVGATIEGAAAVQVIGGNTTLSNAGALVGDVQLRSAGTNKVTLFSGSSIRGDLGIGTNTASTLTLDGQGAQLYSSAVTGTISFSRGILVKQGSGTWTMDQALARSGATQVNAGTLALASDSALGTGAVTVNNSGNLGATLAINTGVSIGNDVLVNNQGTLNNAGTIARTGIESRALRSTTGGAIVNNAGGTLRASGTDGIGVLIENAAGAVTNVDGGTIAGGSGSVSMGVGAARGSTVTNIGGSSTISAGAFGVYLTEGGRVLNAAGKISATENGSAGVYISSGAAQITNTDGGIIQGANAGVYLSDGGTLTNEGGSEIKGNQSVLASGSTTLINAGTLTGNVNLNFQGAAKAHQVTLLSGSSIAGSLGIGTNTASTLTLDGAGDQLYSRAVTGATTFAGTLVKQGGGTWTLDRASANTGATNVAEGTLKAGAANVFSAASPHSVAAGATLDTAGFNQTLASLNNAGTVSLRSATGAVGSTLTVTGAYVGNNGVLQVATALADSASDRLLLSGAGAIASGNTQVQVTNVSGLGALTKGNGIPVVVAENGARIEANAFSLPGGHVDAGAFEYRMAGDEQGLYLRSTDTTPVNPVDPSSPPTPLYRAEVPLIAALPEQLREANLAMLANRHQRAGDDIGAMPSGKRQAWGRILTEQRDIVQGGAISPQSHGRLTGFQAGTDLFTGGNADAQWQAGLYVGQLDGDMNVSGFSRGIANLEAGRNTLKNQYLGAYGSYQSSSGLYAEAVLQAARHRYGVKAIMNAGADGKGSSLLASLEVGQSFPLAPGWGVEPQLQIVHQSLELDDIALGGLTSVDQKAKSSWSLRAGIRVQGGATAAIGTLKPYGRLNIYKSSNGTDSASYRTPVALTVIGTPTGGTHMEVAAGATLALSGHTSVYGEIGQLRGIGGTTRTRSEVNASVGMKVRW